MKEERLQVLEESFEFNDESVEDALWGETSEKQQEDPFTALMFGGQTKKLMADPFRPIRSTEHQQPTKPMIDYQQLMIHFDTLWTSVQELKPLFGKIHPIIKQFLEKK